MNRFAVIIPMLWLYAHLSKAATSSSRFCPFMVQTAEYSHPDVVLDQQSDVRRLRDLSKAK